MSISSDLLFNQLYAADFDSRHSSVYGRLHVAACVDSRVAQCSSG